MVTLKVDNVPYSTSVDELRRTFEKLVSYVHCVLVFITYHRPH